MKSITQLNGSAEKPSREKIEHLTPEKFAVLILFTLLFIGGAYFIHKNPVNKSKLNAQKADSVFSACQRHTGAKLNVTGAIDLTNPIEQELLEATAVDMFEPQMDKARIFSYKFAKLAQKAVYAVTYPDDSFTEVYLLDLNSGTKVKIFEKPTVIVSDSEGYRLRITDVGISDDGTLVAITTARGVVIYDGDISELFSIPTKEEGLEGIWHYSNPQFSRDNRYLSMSEGYSYGSLSKVFDINQSKFLDISYASHTERSFILGWLENKYVLLKFGLGDAGGIFLVSPEATANEELVVKAENTLFNYATLLDDNVYFVKDQRSEEVSKCNGNPISKYTNEIQRVNLTDKSLLVLQTIDQTDFQNGQNQHQTVQYMGVLPVNSQLSLIVGVKESSVRKFYTLGESAFSLLELKMSSTLRDEDPTNSQVLLTKITYTGGLCPNGTCNSTVEIFGNGAVNKTNESGEITVLPSLDPTVLDSLKQTLSSLEPYRLMSKKFEDTCPIAFDGQKAIYELTYGIDSVVVIDSCEYQVDPEEPIFNILNSIIN